MKSSFYGCSPPVRWTKQCHAFACLFHSFPDDVVNVPWETLGSQGGT